MNSYDFYVGIDWGYEQHQACLVDSHGDIVAQRNFSHGDGLNRLSEWIASHIEELRVAIAIEVPHGPVVETMMERGYALYAINPKQLDRFRDRLSPSGAKDDRRDAQVLAISLRSDRHCFRQLQPNCAKIIELRELSRIADQLMRIPTISNGDSDFCRTPIPTISNGDSDVIEQ